MNINPLSSSMVNMLVGDVTPAKSKQTAGEFLGGGFSDILTEAMNTAELADRQDKASAIELLSGQSDDMSGLLLDAQKAEISLSLALQIRSKILEAYDQIIKMQI